MNKYHQIIRTRHAFAARIWYDDVEEKTLTNFILNKSYSLRYFTTKTRPLKSCFFIDFADRNM
jgi:hypothetical protein